MTPLLVFFGVFAFIFGLMIGSFLNVCIYRLPREESLIYPPSHCPKCYQPIRWEDNIPIISWLMLRGKCRACGLSISPIYPVIELLSGALFALFYVRFAFGYMQDLPAYPSSGELFYYGAFYLAHMAFIGALVVATVIDFRYFIIPDVISVPGIPLAVLASAIFPQLHGSSILPGHPHVNGIISSLAGAATGAGLIYGLGAVGKVMFGKEAMGFGDVKLMGMIGAFLGWQLTVFVILLSALLGTVYGVIRLAMTGESKIPYGPFLSAAAIIALMFRHDVVGFLGWTIQTYRLLLKGSI